MDVVYVIVITSLICHIIIETFSVIDFISKLIFLHEARVALSFIFSVYNHFSLFYCYLPGKLLFNFILGILFHFI